MIIAIIKTLAGVLVAPLTKLGTAWIDHRRDQAVLEHGTERVAIQSSTTMGLALLGTWAGRIPVFVLLISVDLHVAAVFVDSTWPSDWLNPLALPERYEWVLYTVVAAQTGLAAFRAGRRGR